MRKILITLILIITTILMAFLGWYFFFRNPNIPAGEAIRAILPFGSAENTEPTTDNQQETTETSTQPTLADEFDKPTANLLRISEDPVAGAVVLKRGTSTVVVRYVDRATGHIYETDLATLVKVKITNQTLPKIYEAHFRSDGNTVLFRAIKDNSDLIENIILSLTPPKTASSSLYTISSTLLRGDIDNITLGANTLFYTLRDTSTIVSSTFTGTGIKTLFSSAFNNWRLALAGNNLVVYTKASANVPGYAYTLNTAGGSLIKILGPLNGLTITSNPVGSRVLYSYFENNSTKLFIKNLQNNNISEILPATIAEKCVWSSKNSGIFFCGTPVNELLGVEPDSWYQGLTHFSDYLWRFDTNSETAELIAEPRKEFGVDLDVFEPKLAPNEDYLVFKNKKDLSLWTFKLDNF